MNTKLKIFLTIIFILLLSLSLLTASSLAQDPAQTLTVTTERVSVSSDGMQGEGRSILPSISADGRYVAFESIAINMVDGDTNGFQDVFVHDRVIGETTRVSVASDGTQGNNHSGGFSSISVDGRYVAFESFASNMVDGDTNGVKDVFVHDRVTGETMRVSIASDGTQGNDISYSPSISSDGRYVAFDSYAFNLVDGDSNGVVDVFVHDRVMGETTRVSVASNGTQGNWFSNFSPISADGRYVAFESGSTNLVDGDTNGWSDVFVHDRVMGETTRVSVASDGTQGNGDSYWPSISADGRYVAFGSIAINMVDGDTNGFQDIFVHDRVTGETTRVSVTSDGTQGNGDSSWSSVSADGCYVAFESGSTNLVDGDTNGWEDVFVHDRVMGETTRVSVASDGTQGNGKSYYSAISADGRYVTFTSDAFNLVDGDTNGVQDIFVHDQRTYIGFLPNPGGYSFANYGGINYGDYSLSDMRRMFGDDAVCKMNGQTCNPIPAAQEWNRWANQSMNGGHCYGMAVTSLRFFKNMDAHPSFPTVYALDKSSNVSILWGGQSFTTTARRNIGFFAVTQFPDPVRYTIDQALAHTPEEVLAQLSHAMAGGAPDPMILVMFFGKSGHAITPYAISNPSYGLYWIWVYDNNNPGDANRYVVINTNTNTWNYNTGHGTWSGGPGPNTLAAIPTSIHSQPMQCPWCSSRLENTASAHILSMKGDGHILIIDSQGRRLGYVGDQYVEEIPGGYGLVPILGTQVESEPIYTLPLTETYTILLDGQTLTQAASASLAQFGPGYAVSVENLAVNPTAQDQLSIANNGSQLAYHASQPQEPTLTLAVESLSASYGLEIQGADIAASHAITLTADTTAGDLTLNGSQLFSGAYNLSIRMVNLAGLANYYHANIPMLATDTHIIVFGAWDGTGMITLEIDHLSDGTIDETVELENQMQYVFLPVIELHR